MNESDYKEIAEKIENDYLIIKKQSWWKPLVSIISVLVGFFGLNYAIFREDEVIKKKREQAIQLVEYIKTDSIESQTLLTTFNRNFPLATIIPWHPNIKKQHGETININLPTGWVKCDGSVITDSESPLLGAVTPNLNGNKLFIRGSEESGIIQDQSWKNLHIRSQRSDQSTTGVSAINSSRWNSSDIYTGWSHGPEKVGINLKWGNEEIKPKNFSVIWIMKIK